MSQSVKGLKCVVSFTYIIYHIAINRSSCHDLASRYYFQVALASELQDVWCEEIWNIFEHNMKQLYVLEDDISYRPSQYNISYYRYESSSFGWDPQEKKKEMFHSLSRFLLVCSEGEHSAPKSLLAYSIFRFEREDDRNLVYW